MALIVGDNSYLDVVKFDDIKSYDFIIDSLTTSTDNDLINGTSLMDALFTYKGVKAVDTQLLEFPRIIDTKTVGIEGDIELIAARLTYYLITEPDMFKKSSSDTNQQIKKEKMDVFETEYFEFKGDSSVEFIYKLDIHTRTLLEKYIIQDLSASNTTKVIRVV